MKIFISWSGEESAAIAKQLSIWIKQVIQAVDTFYSMDKIHKGARWTAQLEEELNECNLGIICLTKDNLESQWMMFEAGALAHSRDKSKVIPLLLGIKEDELTGPLSYFQHAEFSKNGMLNVLKTINEELEDKQLDNDFLLQQFNMLWPTLELNVSQILGKESRNEKTKEINRLLGPNKPVMGIIVNPDNPDYWVPVQDYYKWYNAQYRLASNDLIHVSTRHILDFGIHFKLLLFECNKDNRSINNYRDKFQFMRRFVTRLHENQSISIEILERKVAVRIVNVKEMPQYTFFCTKKDNKETAILYLEDMERGFVKSGVPKVALETQYELLVREYESTFDGYWYDRRARELKIKELLNENIPDSEFFS